MQGLCQQNYKNMTGWGEVDEDSCRLRLAMADDGLNGGTPFELALDLRREAALLARVIRIAALARLAPRQSRDGGRADAGSRRASV